MNQVPTDIRDEKSELTDYRAIPLNDVVMKIAEGIMKLRSADVDPYDPKYLIRSVGEEEMIRFNRSQLGAEDEEKVKRMIRFSQVQLFIYLLYAWRQAQTSSFQFDRNEFYRLRAIQRRSVNNRRLIEDLNVLAAITISLKGKNKKDCYHVDGELLQYEVIGKEIYIIMGSWIEELSLRVFTNLNVCFFHYHSINEWVTGMLSLKLAQLSAVNKHAREIKVSQNTLFDILDFSVNKIKKQGMNRYETKLLNSFAELDREGYELVSKIPTSSGYNYLIKAYNQTSQ